MPDQRAPGAPLGEPDPSTRREPHTDRGETTGPGGGITWYTVEPDRDRARAGAAARARAQRRLGRVVAVVAVALALLFAGAGVARQISNAGASSSAPPDGMVRQPLGVVPSAPASSAPDEASTPADVAAVAAKVIPAVAYITVENSYTSGGGSATGIVLTADGYVLTNHHVIDGATAISATLVGNGQTYSAEVAGYDSGRDIALIKLQGADGLQTAEIGQSSGLAVGDVVVGAGNAGGAGGAPIVVAGVVLALDQQIVARDGAGGAQFLRGLIHTDADVRSGHSGGPLADADGEVVGVMTAASMGSPHGPDPSDTDGFAVPIDTAMAIVAQIRAGDDSGTVHVGETAFLGVQTADVGQGPSGYADPHGYGDPYGDGDPYGYGDPYGEGEGGASGQGATGAAVIAVVPGSPAEGAGLAAGDVVTAVNGSAVTSAEALSALIAEYQPGDTVTVSWTDSSGVARSALVELVAGPAR